MRFRKSKLFNKVLIALGACVFALSCLCFKTYAYTPSSDETLLYSDNGLNIPMPDINYKYLDNFSDNIIPGNALPSSSIWIGGSYNNTWARFSVRIYSGTDMSASPVRIIVNDTNVNNSFQTVDLGFANGISSQFLRTYQNQYLVFVNQYNFNGVYRGSAVGYRIGSILDYFDMFSDSTTNYTYWYLTYRLVSYNVAVPGSLRIEDLGVFRGSSMITQSQYEPYYIYSTVSQVNQESYNQGVQSQQATITDLQNQVSQLQRANQILQNDLAAVQDTKMRSLIWTIGSTPFESFKTIWDVNIWGVNIGGIILGGLMALLVLYLIKKIWK